ncbi:unnamed protein product [Brachionus calyciflorus]|uniref:Uncharacterized protein n=1 Tax=Brachionus calyciflorus TaxID=104777 RepID=A0A813MZ41_9BILA|nr:unnamed protein product [Brachionus calyciflorus]
MIMNESDTGNFCHKNCKECSSDLRFNLLEIKSGKISLRDLNEELSKHDHPSSRKNKENKNRTKCDAIKELKFHYLYHHTNKEVIQEINAELKTD